MPVITGLIASNFAYQLFLAEPNMATAFERSFFQVVAIGVYVLYKKVSNG